MGVRVGVDWRSGKGWTYTVYLVGDGADATISPDEHGTVADLVAGLNPLDHQCVEHHQAAIVAAVRQRWPRAKIEFGVMPLKAV